MQKQGRQNAEIRQGGLDLNEARKELLMSHQLNPTPFSILHTKHLTHADSENIRKAQLWLLLFAAPLLPFFDNSAREEAAKSEGKRSQTLQI